MRNVRQTKTFLLRRRKVFFAVFSAFVFMVFAFVILNGFINQSFASGASGDYSELAQFEGFGGGGNPSGGASYDYTKDNSSNNITVGCGTYKYPWCQESTSGPAGLVNQFYKIALGLVGACALGVLIYGAILWTLSGGVSSKQDALEWIKAAVWGLALLLAAYLILYTINPDLVSLKNSAELIKSLPSANASTQTNSSVAANSEDGLSEQAAREKLSGDNIGVKQACSTGEYENCVDLGGIRKETIDEITSLSSSVGSENVYVTAGTEGCGTTHLIGTYSHCNGYKTDLRLNTNLNNYITGNYEYIGTRSDGAKMYKSSSGATYALEKDHWDVLVI